MTAGRRRTEYVFCALPRCPYCGSKSITSTRSIEQCDLDGNPDGTRKRWSICETCEEKFFVIFE